MRTGLVVLGAVLLAGCGHASSRGRVVFQRSCAPCHTLTGHDTNVPGGDLRLGHLTAADVASFARVMPVRPPLDAADTRAVARYVAGG
jgi:mono/diheme cytochrome c family protein